MIESFFCVLQLSPRSAPALLTIVDHFPSYILIMKSFEPLNGLDLCLCWEPHRFKWRSYFFALINFPHLGQTGIKRTVGRYQIHLAWPAERLWAGDCGRGKARHDMNRHLTTERRGNSPSRGWPPSASTGRSGSTRTSVELLSGSKNVKSSSLGLHPRNNNLPRLRNPETEG